MIGLASTLISRMIAEPQKTIGKVVKLLAMCLAYDRTALIKGLPAMVAPRREMTKG